jgi:arylsulfatase A-like enzyme
MGHSRILTPTLNRLAGSGTLFTQAYSTTPTCIPARRALMTGTSAKTHGDRIFDERREMPANLPTLPQTFRNNGYQAFAVGKLHVYPQRDRIGFDDVILNEEGRHQFDGRPDDFELFLKHQGYAGQELTHGMGNNEYVARPWHLPESCHPTNWTTREMCRTIQRRDPRKPGFWYCSYVSPHPPITPPRDYWDMYMNLGVDDPIGGDWARDPETWPYALKKHNERFQSLSPTEARLARMGFYAQCTYIDHQIRLLIGTLREEGLLDNTVILFTGDHGDMLGNHNLWCKPPMLEWSAKIPMILVPATNDPRYAHHRTDDRLVCLRDVMPTLLDLCNLNIPPTVEGMSMVGSEKREQLLCEHYEDERAFRMLRTRRHKLIWYPVGNRFQLFDLVKDPNEMHDLSALAKSKNLLAELKTRLLSELWGSDFEQWVRDGKLVGEPDRKFVPGPNRSLLGQRGWR